MARNMMREVTEKQRAISDAIAKMVNSVACSRIGRPFLSLKLPGILAVEEKATVAIRAATTEHELEVLFSHFPPLRTSSP